MPYTSRYCSRYARAAKSLIALAKKSASTAANAAAEVEDPTRVKPPADEGIDVPTEYDFDEAVAKQITPESDLQKELDKLEQEIGQ